MKSAKVLPTCYDAAAEEDRKVDGTSIYQSEKASLKPIFLAVEDLHGDFSVDKLLELTKLHQFQLHFQGLLGVMKVISNSIYISTFSIFHHVAAENLFKLSMYTVQSLA
jgi:hypothetical protein